MDRHSYYFRWQEINLHDSPTIITILDSPSNTTSGLLMCVGYKYVCCMRFYIYMVTCSLVSATLQSYILIGYNIIVCMGLALVILSVFIILLRWHVCLDPDGPVIVDRREPTTFLRYSTAFHSFCRYHYEIVCEQTGQSSRLHELESSKRAQSQLVAAVDLCDGQETELLLCYNRKSIFHTYSSEHHIIIICTYV